jgi:hypothetical protein
MKPLRLIGFLLAIFATNFNLFAQSGPPAPSTGIWAIIDTNYTVGTTTQGFTTARITSKNTTLSKYTGVQFRVFYDKIAFTNATVSLLGSPTNLDFQYITNAANGYITMTLVYTGSSSTYTLPDGERFEINFTHAASSVFNNLATITPLAWSVVPAANPFQQYAATQEGADTTLNLHNYGGNFIFQNFDYHGTFTNVTGTPAKNLTLALQRRPLGGNVWSQHSTYVTDINGDFAISVPLDTTYWDVRLAIQGDSMAVGNVISTADAQLINQWVLGNGTMTGFDYYAADVNESDNVTITDAYGVFGRISGRFAVWPNNTKDVKFFTQSEYNTINGSATNYTSSIAGATNFTFEILPGQPDSVVYYVVVPGDANGTGYHMARVTPIEVIVGPAPGLENQIYNVIDTKVEYDFPTESVEVNVPHISVQEGNLVNVPVKVLTNGKELNSLQFGLKYNSDILSFKGIYSTSSVMEWLTYVNPNDGEVDWGGYDITNNQKTLKDGDEVITLQFVALQPQNQWDESPLYTTRKFAGNASNYKDLTLTPTNGILQVLKISNGQIIDANSMLVYPNPFEEEVTITFSLSETSNATLYISDLQGRKLATILTGQVPNGQFSYYTDLGKLESGLYFVTLTTENGNTIVEKIAKIK